MHNDLSVGFLAEALDSLSAGYMGLSFNVYVESLSPFLLQVLHIPEE